MQRWLCAPTTPVDRSWCWEPVRVLAMAGNDANAAQMGYRDWLLGVPVE